MDGGNYTPGKLASNAYAEAEAVPAHKHRAVFIELASKLEPLRDKAIRKKGPVEDRMLNALSQYHGWGGSKLTNTKNKALDSKNDKDGPPVIHITRQITDQITSKIINMLLPSNERGWSIEPTPVPELLDVIREELKSRPSALEPEMVEPAPDGAMGNPLDAADPQADGMGGMGYQMDGQMAPMDQMGGQPMPEPEPEPTPAMIAQRELDEAEKRAKAMQRLMDDQLAETKFAKLGRSIIKSACKIGTGILHGPVMTGKTKVKYVRKVTRDELGNDVSVWVKEISEDSTANFQEIDPFSFYPEPVESLEVAEYAWVYESMSPSRVNRLKKWPGFEAEQIDALLASKPDQGLLKETLSKRANAEGQTLDHKGNYAVWRYFGPLPNSVLTILGHDTPATGDEDDMSHETMCEVWLSQGIVIKVKISPQEEAERLPFYAMCFEESDTSIFGYGIPDQLEDSQVVIDASWNMVLHNAAVSSGPLIIRKKGALVPMDGDNNISGGLKQFEVDSTEMDERFTMDRVIKVINIDARTDQLMQINERAIENAQRETNFPNLAQGEPTESVTTTSGLAMLMNSQTAPQRTIAQYWDDEVMIPALEELYDFNMIYHPSDDVKGDFNITAYGATRLVNKDMQAQHLQVIAGLSDNPRFTAFSKDYNLWKEILKTAELDSDRLSITEDEYDQLQNSPPDPMNEATVRELNAKAAKFEAEAEQIKANLSRSGEPEQMTESDRIRWAELELKERTRVSELQMEEMELEQAELRAVAANEIEMAKMAERRQERLENARLQQSLKVHEIDSRQTLEGAKIALQVRNERNRERNMDKGFDSYG